MKSSLKVLLSLGLCLISCGWLLAIDCPVGDYNDDCIVDIQDLLIVADKWLYPGWICPEPGIAAIWKMDETAGDDVPDLTGLHPGQTVSDPIWRPGSGKQSGALELDGVDDYITIPGYAGIIEDNARTCAAWINTHDAVGDIMSWGNMAAGQLWRIRVFTDTTLRQLRVGIAGGYIMSSVTIPADQWVHVAVVLPSGKSDIQDVILYINGLPDTAASSSPAVINTSGTTDILIGYDGTAEYYQGLLDDIRIYNRGLTAAEIWAVYSTGTTVQRCVDLNGDGAVNITDLSPISTNWLREFGPVVISEFLAENDSKLPLEGGEILDGNGESSDWIELYNLSGATVDLEGWSLTDTAATPQLWTFPKGATIGSGQYLIVFASKKEQSAYPKDYPYQDSKGYWHTNFKLDTGGEYLALADPAGRRVTEFKSYEFSPGQFGYPPQKKNISYGLYAADVERYFSILTPGKANAGDLLGIVADTKFSVNRGFYSDPFLLEITSDPKVVKDAIIRYTTDGSTPSESTGKTYTGPITISKTTCVRAMAYKPGYHATGVDTHTYLFVQDIITQSENPADYGPGWPYSSGQTMNYGMDKKITTVEPWKSQMAAAMVSIPSMSVVTDLKNLFDPATGIYVNASQDGVLWERPCSLEMIYPDGTQGFQVNCGIRIRGGYSRSGGNPKHAFRFLFKALYGPGKLHYPLFGDEGPDEFDNIDFATAQNYSWSFDGGSNGYRNTFCRDMFSRDLAGDMGLPYSRGRYYHLYIDGAYWGLYYTDERTEASYGQTYLGGNEDDYDVVKVTSDGYIVYATDGTFDAWTQLWNAAIAGFATDDAYYRIQGLDPDGTRNPVFKRLVDVDNVIDCAIATYYMGDYDCPISNFLGNSSPNNFYGMYNRINPDGFKYFRHDAEHTMQPGWDRTGPWSAGQSGANKFNPQFLHQQLAQNANYRLRFADRVHRYFFNSGILTPQANIDRWMNRANQIQMAIIGESARWGDSKRSTPYTKQDWLNEINNLVTNYFPGRTNEVLTQLKNKTWYPNQAAPVFGQVGGKVEAGFNLTMTGPAGTTTYYTLDGTDPRVFFSTEPVTTITLVAESAPKKVLIPNSTTGTTWRGGNEPFADSGWTAGTPQDTTKSGGAGYDRKATKTYTPYISYAIESAMYNVTSCALIRIPFTVAAGDLARFQSLDLKIRYDDGFVAYLNGTVVATRNFTGTPLWNSVASASHDGRTAETISLAAYLSSLKAGTNILAIHGMTRVSSSNNNDFLISAEMTANRAGAPTGSVSPKAIPYTGPVVLTKSCPVKARTYTASTQTWSALKEATFSIGPVVDNLRISEVMYHPDGDPNSEFVELYNSGSETLDLSLVRFEKGIDFAFGLTPSSTTIAPNGYLVLAKTPTVFSARYPTVPVAGQYAGALDSNGERIRLVDAIGTPIADFAYSNNWFDITDGVGFSLALRDPQWDPPAITTEGLVSLWRMDETAGTAVSDSQGAHPGQTVNMDNSNWVSGRLGNGLQFDGVNEFVTIPGYKGILGGASRTVSLWIQTTDRTGGQLVSWGVNDVAGQKWVVRLWPNDANHTALRVEVWGAPIVGTTDLADGQWHHVAATLADDGSPNVNEVVLYVDGRREAISLAGQQAIDTAAGDDIRLGVFTTPYFRGRMDHVAIYNRALTDAEIAPMYQSRPLWDDKSYWRPSAAKGGSPGAGDGGIVPELGSVVINEVLSHSHGTDPDWIELHNTTDQPIPIGGWFLSDNTASEPNRMSYRIPSGTVIPRNGFVVFNQTQHFGNPQAFRPFGLSEGGGTVYLQSGSGGQLTGYVADESFGAAESGVSFGRYLKSTLDGGYNFVAMNSLTPNGENALPKVGPIVITEIHYNPGTKPYDWDKEYIELKNISGAPVTLQWYDQVNNVTVPWKFTDGIEFEFPLDTTIGAGKRILVVKNKTALRTAFPTIPADVPVFQWTSGSLDNAGEKIELSRPGDLEPGKDRFYIRMERVSYNNASPWPGADGTGKSLTRIADTLYGNDAANWQAATPSPGQ